MRRESFDAVSMVEALYSLETPDEAWLERFLVSSVQGLGVPWALAMSLRSAGGRVEAEAAVSTGIDIDAIDAARFLASMPEELVDTLVRLGPRCSSVSDLEHWNLLSPADVRRQRDRASEFAEWARVPRISNKFVVRGYDIGTETGTVLLAPCAPGTTPTKTLERWERVSAHVAAATRLRRKLRAPERVAAEALDGEAIFDGDGHLVHAIATTGQTTVRDALREAVVTTERCRAQRSAFEPDEALALWRGLVDGRWSLVDRFDSDGRRFIVAHRNAPGVRDPRGLSEAECAVATLLVRGASNKAIAYELGLATSTVAGHVSQMQRKLGAKSRVALVMELKALVGSAGLVAAPRHEAS